MTTTRTLTRLAAFVAIALTATGSAFAQTTITQDKAMAGAVTAGDTAGFPISINQTGSYKLMSNLVVPWGINAIEVHATNVTIDLNGFAIIGPGSCTRDDGTGVVSCTVQSGTYGISSPQGIQSNVLVRNGAVQGFAVGVSVAAGSAEQLRLRHNQYGVIASGQVSHVTAQFNGTGVLLNGGQADHCAAVFNDVGFTSTFVNESSVQSSHASFNRIGMQNVGTHGSFSRANKTNVSNTTAY